MTWFDSGTGGFEFAPEIGRITQLCPIDSVNVLQSGTLVEGVVGGDRCWLGPELAHFYAPHTETTSTEWRCPVDMDPGCWRANGTSSSLQFYARSAMQRSVAMVEHLPLAKDLAWAGYHVEDLLLTDRPWAPWHVVAVPHPAQIYVRATQPANVYYPPVPERVEDWYPVCTERWKAGFPVEEDGIVFLAALGESDPGSLVIVTSRADPDGTYVDTPPKGGVASPVQVFSFADAGFCELEHHAPLETRWLLSTVVGIWGSRSSRLNALEILEHSTTTFEVLPPTNDNT